MRQKHRLEGIVLNGIGVFDNVRIDFPPISSAAEDARKAEIHILTGANGCGKSTLLYAMAALFANQTEPWMLASRARRTGSSVDYRFADITVRDEVLESGSSAHLAVHDDGPFGKLEFVGMEAGDRSRFYGEYASPLRDYCAFQGVDAHRVTALDKGMATAPSFPFAVFAYAGQKSTADGTLAAVQEISESPFQNALSFDNSVRPHLLIQWVANKRAEAALARSENDSEAADAAENSIARITAFIKTVCDLDVVFKLNRRPLGVSMQIEGREVGFSVLPDGLKSIISWVADLAIRLEMVPWRVEREPFEQEVILLLDEIDIYLHPRWQRRILPALQHLLPNSQIFVSTHSPFVVGSVEDALIYQLDEKVSADTGMIEGKPSAAGHSYNAILDAVFGVGERFDVETERAFRRLYELRDAVISGSGSLDDFKAAASTLMMRSEEVSLIVGREVRQLGRIIGKEIEFASDD